MDIESFYTRKHVITYKSAASFISRQLLKLNKSLNYLFPISLKCYSPAFGFLLRLVFSSVLLASYSSHLIQKMNTSSEPNSRRVEKSLPNKIRKSSWLYKIFDPSSPVLAYWDRIFLGFCLLSIFVDPLYFYLPYVGGPGCVTIHHELVIIVIVLRSLSDLCYLINIILKFRTAFIMRGTSVVGRGQLVMDPRKIASHYLNSDLGVDMIATIPLPQMLQIMIWGVLHRTKTNTAVLSNGNLALCVLLQYGLRLYLIFGLHERIVRNSGVVAKTAWAGAAYNILLYLLASHVFGAVWYLMSVQRQQDCWISECLKDRFGSFRCIYSYLDCNSLGNGNRAEWLKQSSMLRKCNATEDIKFNYGIFAEAIKEDIVSSDKFINKYLYSVWWGLKTVSSLGQNLDTSLYVPEGVFCIVVTIVGLVLFGHLLGNIQTYLQSISAKFEEWRLRRRDADDWMNQRRVPQTIQERVRRFFRFKWLSTRGVDEDAILRSLPADLRRDIKRHLCLPHLLRIPFFSNMDRQLLDAVCDRLQSFISIKEGYIVREGDPVYHMLFIMRGKLESITTNGGRSGFLNSITLNPGDFCGEELVTWAIMPRPSPNLPFSTRTIRALSDVEAFALRADDLKYVANRFKRLNSRKLQQVFRYYSHQWRTWAALYIQAAWRRYKRRKSAQKLQVRDSFNILQAQAKKPKEENYEDTMEESSSSMDNVNNGQRLGLAVLSSWFLGNVRRAHRRITGTRPDDPSLEMLTSDDTDR